MNYITVKIIKIFKINLFKKLLKGIIIYQQ